MARLSLYLLGPFRAFLDKEPIAGFESAKVRALLAYLATEADRPHPRGALVGLLWPDWPEAAAFRNLSRALSNLRTAIGDRDAAPPYLSITRETIQFNTASDCWVDVHAFGDLSRAAEDRSAVGKWADAPTLYQGSFLDGFSLKDSAAFDDWTLLVRERLARQMAMVLQRLVEAHERQGEYEQACTYAWRQVEMEPWREDAHQQLMRALALSGQRAAALAQYAACRRALEGELGVEPGAETARLYEQIRDGKLTVPRPSLPTETLAGPLPSRPVDGAAAMEARVPLPPPPARTPAEAERRVVTVLSARIKGIPPTGQEIDVELWADIVRRTMGMLEREVHRYGGTVGRFREDGLVAYFGAGAAHEDDPERAVLAALGMREAVRTDAAELAAREGICVQLRVAVNTGEVILARVGERGERGADVALGRAMSVAQVLETAATEGVLVGESTYRLVHPLFEWHAVGEFTVAGERDPLAVYRPLAWKALPGKGRGIPGLSSPLVGRDAELHALQGTIERLRAGVGGVVTVVGEAGIGKSRLVAEIREICKSANGKSQIANPRIGEPAVRQPSDPAATTQVQWIEGRCLSYAMGEAYSLWLDLLRGLLGVTGHAAPAAAAEALREQVGRLCPGSADEVYPFLAQMMSLPLLPDAEARLRGVEVEGLKVLTFRAVRAVLEGAARNVPLTMVFEDLHWADPTSLALLEYLLPLTDRVPLLLICVLRPVTEHGCWRIREAAARDYRHRHTDLWLDPLTERESAELVAHLLRIEDVPEALRAPILEHAEGNPFCVEEVLRSLIDRGIFVHDEATGRWGATQEVADLPVPDTLRGVLMARIDRLPEPARHVLQAASVVGRIFGRRVLESVSQRGRALDDDLATHLVVLERAQMVRQRARLPEEEYIFKHQLTLETAYEGLLRRQRRDLHRRAAQALERLYAERVEEQLGLLAHHWERAGDAERAVSYLRRAGEYAAGQYANEEATAWFCRALDLLPEERREERFRLLSAREQIYHLLGMREAQQQDLQVLQALAEALGREGDRVIVALRRANYAAETGARVLADSLLDQALPMIERLPDAGQRAQCYLDWARHYGADLYRPVYASTHEQLEKAIALAHAVGLKDVEAECERELGERLRHEHHEQGVYHLERALQISRETGNRRVEAMTCDSLGSELSRIGDDATALRYLERGIHLSREIGNRQREGWGTLGVANLHYDQGDLAAALNHYQRLVTLSSEIRAAELKDLALWGVGRVYGDLGQYAEAVAYYRGLLPAAREAGNPHLAGPLLWYLGLMCYHLGEYTQTEACGRELLLYSQELDEPQAAFGAWITLGRALTGLGEWDEASQAYQRALETASSLMEGLQMTPRMGLVWVALGKGGAEDLRQALPHVEAILCHWEAAGGFPHDTFEAILACYRLLQAVGNPRAPEVLARLYDRVHTRAAQLRDPAHRRAFLEDVRVHREIVAEYEGRSAGPD